MRLNALVLGTTPDAAFVIDDVTADSIVTDLRKKVAVAIGENTQTAVRLFGVTDPNLSYFDLRLTPAALQIVLNDRTISGMEPVAQVTEDKLKAALPCVRWLSNPIEKCGAVFVDPQPESVHLLVTVDKIERNLDAGSSSNAMAPPSYGELQGGPNIQSRPAWESDKKSQFPQDTKQYPSLDPSQAAIGAGGALFARTSWISEGGEGGSSSQQGSMPHQSYVPNAAMPQPYANRAAPSPLPPPNPYPPNRLSVPPPDPRFASINSVGSGSTPIHNAVPVLAAPVQPMLVPQVGYSQPADHIVMDMNSKFLTAGASDAQKVGDKMLYAAAVAKSNETAAPAPVPFWKRNLVVIIIGSVIAFLLVVGIAVGVGVAVSKSNTNNANSAGSGNSTVTITTFTVISGSTIMETLTSTFSSSTKATTSVSTGTTSSRTTTGGGSGTTTTGTTTATTTSTTTSTTSTTSNTDTTTTTTTTTTSSRTTTSDTLTTSSTSSGNGNTTTTSVTTIFDPPFNVTTTVATPTTFAI